jgi:hypothetical protein
MKTVKTEKELIQDVDRWPNWPVLPVKNHKMVGPGSFPECGIIHARDVQRGGKVTVYMVNLFMLPLTEEQIKALQKFEYEDLDAMLAAGWVGD